MDTFSRSKTVGDADKRTNLQAGRFWGPPLKYGFGMLVLVFASPTMGWDAGDLATCDSTPGTAFTLKYADTTLLQDNLHYYPINNPTHATDEQYSLLIFNNGGFVIDEVKVRRYCNYPNFKIRSVFTEQSSTANDFCMVADGPAQNGTPIVTGSCDLGLWVYDESNHYIRLASNQDYCIHKTSAGWDNGNLIHLWQCSQGSNENKQWDSTTSNHIVGHNNTDKCMAKKGPWDTWSTGQEIHVWDCLSSGDENNANETWRLDSGNNFLEVTKTDNFELGKGAAFAVPYRIASQKYPNCTYEIYVKPELMPHQTIDMGSDKHVLELKGTAFKMTYDTSDFMVSCWTPIP